MNDFVHRKIWIPIDVNGDDEAKTLNGSSGLMYKNGELMFCIGLFNKLPKSESDAGEFLNHSLLQAFLLEIRSGGFGAANTKILGSDVGALVEIDPTVTEAQFITKQKAPIQIYCPTSITALNESNDGHYMNFLGSTTDKPVQPDGFGRARIRVMDIGIAAGSALALSTPGAASIQMVNAAVQQCVKYGKNPAGRSFSLTSQNGSYGRLKYTSDDGEDADELLTY